MSSVLVSHPGVRLAFARAARPALPKSHGNHHSKRQFTSWIHGRSTTQTRQLTGSSRAMSSDLVAAINEKNRTNPVVVYSKTYCPYCAEVKGLFQKLNVDAKVIELDNLADGQQVQDALSGIVGRRTVPQVFVGGVHVGGCDDTMAAYDSGKLKSLLKDAGVTIE